MAETNSLSSIKHIILILSGKGGVGKSSTTLQLALTLSTISPTSRIGILDIDLTGPSIPRLLDVEDEKIVQSRAGWKPVLAIPPRKPSGEERGNGGVYCMSLGFLLPDRGSSVVWRGPKKTAMVRQFLSDVDWRVASDDTEGSSGGGGGGGLDYLLIDTPPGTSDEHISLAETLLRQTATPNNLRGAILITTPQAISISDVRKELTFCQKTSIPVLGIIENMSGFMCPCCGEITDIFSKGGGAKLARDVGVEFWGGVPLDGGFVGLVEERKRKRREKKEGPETGETEPEGEEGLLERYRKCGLFKVFEGITGKLVDNCEKAINPATGTSQEQPALSSSPPS